MFDAGTLSIVTILLAMLFSFLLGFAMVKEVQQAIRSVLPF